MKFTSEGNGIVQVSVTRPALGFDIDLRNGCSIEIHVYEEIRLARDPKRSTSTNAAVRVSS